MPDLIAEGPDESIVIEVTSKDSVERLRELSRVSETIERQRGWQFVLVMTNAREPMGPDFPVPLADVDELRNALSDLLDLHALCKKEKGRYTHAVLLSAWAIVEGVLRMYLYAGKGGRQQVRLVSFVGARWLDVRVPGDGGRRVPRQDGVGEKQGGARCPKRTSFAARPRQAGSAVQISALRRRRLVRWASAANMVPECSCGRRMAWTPYLTTVSTRPSSTGTALVTCFGAELRATSRGDVAMWLGGTVGSGFRERFPRCRPRAWGVPSPGRRAVVR